MGTSPPDAVAEAARRRLLALRHELQRQAPAPGSDGVVEHQLPPDHAASTSVTGPLPEVGRHARATVSVRGRWAAWAAERVPAPLRGRARLGGRELGVLALLLGVGLAIAGCVALRTGDAAGDPVPATVPSTASATTSRLATPATGTTPATDAGPESGSGTVVVDVAGKVRRPGVFTLPLGSRVVDALKRAGGARPRVDLTGLNLARVLTDGEQVLVGRPAATGVAAGAAAAPGAPSAGGLVSLNTATLEQLDGLPGVGPVTAQKILSWRDTHGSFSAVDELLEIDGIGEKTLAELAPLVTL